MQTNQPATKQTKQSKPTKSFEQFLNKYVCKDIYTKDKKGKVVKRRTAPKVWIKLQQSLIDKSIKEGYQKKIRELTERRDALPSKDAEGINRINKQIEEIELKQSKLFDNNIELFKLDFVKEYIEAKGDISKITDAELRGYLTVFGNEINAELFKKYIDKFNFDTSREKKYAEVMKRLLDSDKYKLKIFNSTFTHPNMLDENNKPIMRKIGNKEEPMQLYMKRFCKYFDSILKNVIKGEDKDKIIKYFITKFLKDEQKKEFKDEDYKTVKEYAEAKKEKKDMKVEKHIKVAYGLYMSFNSTIDELSKYPKLKDELDEYQDKIKAYDKIKKIEFKHETNQELLQSLIKVLHELKEFKLHEMVFNDFMKIIDFKFKPEVKKKFMKCVEEGDKIEIVEQEYEEVSKGKKTKTTKQVKKQMNLDETQFLIDDVNIFKPVEVIYNSDKYNKMGNLVDVDLSNLKNAKVWHVSLCLRVISEVKRVIAEGQLKGQQQFTIVF